MIVHFHEPPAAQRTGGLDAAIRSLQAALENLGHTVAVNPSTFDARALTAAHFHGLWQPGYPAIARRYRATGVPYIVSPHGMLEPWAWRHKRWKKFPYWYLIERRWVSRADLILGTSVNEKHRLMEFSPKTRVSSLPLGLTGNARPDYASARTKLGWSEDETVLLFLSRIDEKKGLDLLLTALAGLCVSAATRLVIVGPEEQPAYAAKCRSHAGSNAANLPRIEWRGAVWGDEKWPYLQGADLFCLPSRSENFGLVVLEACQVGTPVLTTTTTPWADSLGDRGFICHPSMPSVSEALAKFFAAPRQTATQRAALADWAWTNFHWDTLAPQYASLYEGMSRKASSDLTIK